MTVSYTDQVATAKGLTLLKLLFCRWQGSVLKLLWKDLLVFCSIYYFLQALYHFSLNQKQQEIFQAIVKYAKVYQDNTPLSFLLGSFVGNVFELWWKQWTYLPWPTTLAIHVTSSIHGFDEVGRAMRRTILRYANLSATMIFRIVSPRVRKRFPALKDLRDAGLCNDDELKLIQDLEIKYPGYSKYWLPICWAAALATKAREDGRIRDDFALKTIIGVLNDIRASCADLESFSWVYIPLIYTQTVVTAVYTYFLTALFASQYIDAADKAERAAFVNVVEYLPIILILKFIFFMGWLKVAETMMNPFGDDDDDFNVNSFVDTNLQMSYIIVDEIHADHPDLLKDAFWDEIPQELPDQVHGKSFARHKNEKGDMFDVDDPKMNKKSTSGESLKSVKLRPRADVIDGSYTHLKNIEIAQSAIARERIRQRYRSSSSESSD